MHQLVIKNETWFVTSFVFLRGTVLTVWIRQAQRKDLITWHYIPFLDLHRNFLIKYTNPFRTEGKYWQGNNKIQNDLKILLWSKSLSDICKKSIDALQYLIAPIRTIILKFISPIGTDVDKLQTSIGFAVLCVKEPYMYVFKTVGKEVTTDVLFVLECRSSISSLFNKLVIGTLVWLDMVKIFWWENGLTLNNSSILVFSIAFWFLNVFPRRCLCNDDV